MISIPGVPASTMKPGKYFDFNTSMARRGLAVNRQDILILGQRVNYGTSNAAVPADWVTATVYALGDLVKPTAANANGYWYVKVAGSGNSAGSEPTWATVDVNGCVADGSTIKWRRIPANANIVSEQVVKEIYTSDDAASYFGTGGMIHRMAIAAFRANPYISVSAVACYDNGTTKARWEITITNAATGSGAVRVKIGDRIITATVASGDTAAATAQTIVNKVYEDLASPVYAWVDASVAGKVVLAFKHSGTVGNDLPVSADTDVTTGMTVATTQATTGATDPANVYQTSTGTDLLNAVTGKRYALIVFPWHGTESAITLGAQIKNFLDFMGGPIEKKPSRAFGALPSAMTVANARTTGKEKYNHARVTMAFLPGSTTPAFEIAAAYAAIRAAEQRPHWPLDNAALPGVTAPAVASRLSTTQQELLLSSGITPLETGPGDVVQIVRAITTYCVSSAGIPDTALLDINKLDSLDYVRQASLERLGLRFPAGVINSATMADILDEEWALLKELENFGVVENVDGWKDYLKIERDPQAVGRVNIQVPADVVDGLHVIAGMIILM